MTGFGSDVVAVTVAVFEIVSLVAVTVVTSVTVAEPPFASVPRLHVTVVVPEHEPWVGVAETTLRPGGSTSVTVTPADVVGPAFDTATV